METHVATTGQSYIPLAATLLTILAGFAGYLLQRRNEMFKAISDAKGEAYAGFVKSITTAMGTQKERAEGMKEFVFWRTKVLFYGSDEVIMAYRKWTSATDDQHSRALFDEMLLMMRRDCVRKTQTTTEDVHAISPLRFGMEHEQQPNES